MKPAQIECMLFAFLRLERQQKQDAENKAADSSKSRRSHDSLLMKKHSVERTAFNMLYAVWILYIIIAFSAVKGDEDLEVQLKEGNSLQLNFTDADFKSEKGEIDLILLFKTIQPSGTIFRATGKSGDMMLIELVRGKLRIVIGTLKDSSSYEEILLQDNLCDNQWHQLNVKVMEDTTYAKVDVSKPYSSKTKRMLSLNNGVILGSGATADSVKATSSRRGFHGCISYVILNGLDVLKRINKLTTKINWNCEGVANFDAINFDSKDAYLSFLNPVAPTLEIGLQFRTYYQDGVLVTNEVHNRTIIHRQSRNKIRFTLYLERNVLKLRVNGSVVVALRPSEDIDWGSWHKVRLKLDGGVVKLTLGRQNKAVKIGWNGSGDVYDKRVLIGKGTHISTSFRGWIWNIELNSRRMSYLNATEIKAVGVGIYKMKDFCYPNRCKNGGRCIQIDNGARCNCSKTGYDGETCSKRIRKYNKSCHDYYINGMRTNGVYVIEPGSKPLKVDCTMDDPNGPKTVVRQRQGNSLKSVYETSSSDSDFYYHSFDYGAGKEQVDDLIRISGQCKQYIEFFCSSSTLMFSNDMENALANRYGARWFSNDGRINNYWGGANKKPFTCACGLAGNCTDPSLKCNCDVMDNKWRSDGGYLDDKVDLPVSKIQFSRKYTNPSSMYRLGPLECFGTAAAKTTRKTLKSETRTPKNGSPHVTSTPSFTVKERTSTSTSSAIEKKTKVDTQYDSFSTTTSTETVHNHTYTTKLVSTNLTDSPQTSTSLKTGALTTSFAERSGSLSVDIGTKINTKPRSTSRSMLSNGYARSASTLNNQQMIILVALIAGLALLTLLLIAAVLRQRLFKSGNKLTIELRKDPESGSTCSDKESSNDRSSIEDDIQYQSDVSRIEIIRVQSPFRKQTVSESESSVSSFDTSRYLEVGDESDTGSSSSFTKRKGILKSNTKFVVSSRPRSEGDIDDPSEVIGLIHMSAKNCNSKSVENTSLLSGSKSDVMENVKFHLHPRDATGHDRQSRDYNEHYNDRDIVDVETGFITDSSLSCNSGKSLSSSGSDESNDEFYCNKTRRPKRSVRFTIQELSPKKTAKPVIGICDVRNQSDTEDEVFT